MIQNCVHIHMFNSVREMCRECLLYHNQTVSNGLINKDKWFAFARKRAEGDL